jgi:hypothetical protein
MRMWHTIASQFASGQRRSARAVTSYAEAYEALFSGHGGRKEAEIVLADLAAFTGFYAMTPASELDGLRLADANGMRRVYGRILQFLNLTPDERRGLEQAARLEMVAGHEEET